MHVMAAFPRNTTDDPMDQRLFTAAGSPRPEEDPMNPMPPADPYQSPYPSGAPWGAPSERTGEIAAWLDACEQDLVHPGEVDERLRRAGWPSAHAAAATAQYRQRFNEHTLGYS